MIANVKLIEAVLQKYSSYKIWNNWSVRNQRNRVCNYLNFKTILTKKVLLKTAPF